LQTTGFDSIPDSISVPALARGSYGRGKALSALLLAWCGLLLAGLAFQLGGYPLLDPDEGRNAEVAREMVATGDYLVPRLDGLPYLDKPVLFFAADAFAMRLLGANEFAARLPSLLFALATAGLIAAFAARLFGRESAWIAGTAAAATPLVVVFSRTVIFDSMLTFFLTLALVAFYQAIESATDSAGRRAALGWSVLAWGGMGLGVLTKGPVALAVPLLVAVPYALWRGGGRDRRPLRAVAPFLGPALLLALVLPWIWAMSRQVPEFLHYALVSETWRRMTTDQFERTGPLWFFVPCLLLGALPWSFVALGARRQLRQREDGRLDRRLVFLFLWLGLPFVLFSLSHSKRPQYILPLLPAVALLVAAAWREDDPSRPLPGARAGAVAWIGFGSLLLAAGLALPRLVAAAVVALPAHQIGPLARTALASGLAALLGGVAAWFGAARRETALIALALPAAVLPFFLAPALRAVGDDFSSRDLAAAVAPYLAPGVEVVGVRAYPTSLPFYLGRTVLVVGPRGRELTSNYIIDSFPKWLAAPETPLRPLSWWRGALAACARPMLFVAHSEDRENRAVLARAGLPLRFVDNDFAAYGPCTP